MNDILKCELCGKVIMILEKGGKRTICCDQLMVRLPEQGNENKKGGHVLTVEEIPGGIRVKASGIGNPMKNNHALGWIEATDGKTVSIQRLSPGEAPEAEFPFTGSDVKVSVYCPQHGIWSNHPVFPVQNTKE